MRLTPLLLIALISVVRPVLAADQVHLAVPMSLQPYFIAWSDTGLTYETVAAAFKAKGRQVFPVYVSQRGLTNILATREDIDCAAFQSEAESEGWPSTQDLHPFHDYAVTLAANEIEIKRAEDLAGKKVIAYLGSKESLGDTFKEVVSNNPQYREISNHRAQLKLLIKNRVDVIIADRLLIKWYVDYLTQDSEQPPAITYHDLFQPSQLKFSCRNSDLIKDYLAGLEAIKANGELEKIRSRYLK